MARKKGMGFAGWAALLSIGGNFAQAAALKAVNAAKRALEVRLKQESLARVNAEDRAARAESARDSESRARVAAEAKVRQLTSERDGERVEHQKTKALLAKVQAELATLTAERDRLVGEREQAQDASSQPANA